MLQILWTRYLLENQGYIITENILYQDNKSSIILKKNGKTTSSKRTKHMNVRYFFIKDKVEQEEITLKYCPTEQMWSDTFTKPLQGQQFRTMRAMVMNCPEDYDETTNNIQDEDTSNMMITHNKCGISSQECVGLPVKFLPSALRYKDRPKIQDPKKIQDTYHVVTKKDSRGLANEDTLLSSKKVRWKDNTKTKITSKCLE